MGYLSVSSSKRLINNRNGRSGRWNMKETLIEHGILNKDGLSINPAGIRRLLRHTDLLQQVVEHTSFLQYNASLKVRLQCIIQRITDQPVCYVCKTIVKMRIDGRYRNTFPTFCSSECASSEQTVKQKRRNTNKQRYGSENVLQSQTIKQQATQKHIERFGVDNPLKSPHVRQQINQTNLERYGVEEVGSSEQIRDKIKQTTLEKYGVENVMYDQMFREQIAQTNLERYGYINPLHDHQRIRSAFYAKYGRYYPLQVDKIKQKMQQTMQQRYGDSHSHTSKVRHSIEKLKTKQWLIEQYLTQRKTTPQIANDLGVAESTVLKYLHEHEIEINKNSQGEEQLALFLQHCGQEVIRNTRNVISPKEIDIFLPDHSLAIEYDGVFWHSELNGKDKRYHLQKSVECGDTDIRLIHVFDTEWLFQTDIVKSRLRSILGLNQTIAARKCSVAKIDAITANDFYQQTHIQGGCNSSLNYALYYNNQIVAVMSFGRSRYASKYQYELLRFCNCLNTNVVGGATKLFQAFRRDKAPRSVVSYSDLRWNTGTLYRQLGFNYSHTSSPNYQYFKPKQPEVLYSRVTFQKHKLKDKLQNFDPNKTEWKNMIDHGYDRIWDCGNDVYVWKSV